VGGDPLNGGPAYVGVQTNYRNGNENDPYPSVHAPWYGYLLFNEATKGKHVRFTYNERDTKSTCGSSVKVRVCFDCFAGGSKGGGWFALVWSWRS